MSESVDQRGKIGIGQERDLGDFMRGAEAIEEMHEGNAGA